MAEKRCEVTYITFRFFEDADREGCLFFENEMLLVTGYWSGESLPGEEATVFVRREGDQANVMTMLYESTLIDPNSIAVEKKSEVFEVPAFYVHWKFQVGVMPIQKFGLMAELRKESKRVVLIEGPEEVYEAHAERRNKSTIKRILQSCDSVDRDSVVIVRVE